MGLVLVKAAPFSDLRIMSVSSSPRPASVEKIVQRFQRASDPKRRYEQLLWFAKKLEDFPEAEKRRQTRCRDVSLRFMSPPI